MPNPEGRPTEYREEFNEQAEKICNLGATDNEIADFFGVDVSTINRWKIRHPQFCESIKVGKENSDERVKRALYNKATGFKYKEEQAFKIKVDQFEEKVEIVEVERESLPDTQAAFIWLKNRCGWKDKQDLEHSGPNGGPIEHKTTVEYIEPPSEQ